MSGDPTIQQGQPEQLRSQEMSLQRGHPPAQVPGYELERLLGMGAYGEVWVAIERNTGRRVAVKFYAHRGGLDWSLLSREVEKLAFLFADRYVVQLIGVGWDAEPPYYVMEYLERGSLGDRLQQGRLPVQEAVAIFHDVAVGLAHAHGKGVLHCDLKPANILLDQDSKPRLADFGQSRLSHEQQPALGTLFYMAPEQADLNAIPDARWDVYALGALLHCMLVGNPPYREAASSEPIQQAADLSQRLSQYRRIIRRLPTPTEHRRVPGVDRALADIVDGCLDIHPAKRFPNIQAVLDALRVRAVQRARRPLMVLGAIGPLLLLAVGVLFAWWGFGEAIRRSEESLTLRALESDRFAAQYVSRAVASELEDRFRAIERLSISSLLRKALTETTSDAGFRQMLVELSAAKYAEPNYETEGRHLRQKFAQHPLRRRVQNEFNARVADRPQWPGVTWTLCDARGVQLARVPESAEQMLATIGRTYSWRSYFTGRPHDMKRDWRPLDTDHLQDVTLARVYRDEGRDAWMAAVSAPIIEDEKGTFMGVVAMSLEVGRFVTFEGAGHQFAVLVDMNAGPSRGVLLQHPLFQRMVLEGQDVPEQFANAPELRATVPLRTDAVEGRFYRDPVANDPLGQEFDKAWLAQAVPVSIRGRDTGWMVIIQEDYDTSIGEPLGKLRTRLLHYGLAAVSIMVVVLVGTWGLAIRFLRESTGHMLPAAADRGSERSGSGSIRMPHKAGAKPAAADVPDAPAANDPDDPSTAPTAVFRKESV